MSSQGTYLFSFPAPIPIEPGVVASGQYNDGVEDRWLYLTDRSIGDPLDYPDARPIGHWDIDGTALGAVHSDYADFIRPFGNGPTDGSATDNLDYHGAAGNAQRNMQEVPVVDTLGVYPAGNQPMICTMARRWDSSPGWEGNGWQFTVEFADPNRDATNRAVGIYSDPECQNYLYTTGALALVEDKYQTVNPVGKATLVPEPIFCALLHGSFQEGIMNLLENEDESTLHFWENNL